MRRRGSFQEWGGPAPYRLHASLGRSVGGAAIYWSGRGLSLLWAGRFSLLSQSHRRSCSFAAMASASRSFLSGALCSLLLCMLMSLPVPVLMTERGMLVGGWRDRSVSDPDVQNAVSVAVDHYNKASNSLCYSRAVDVLEARCQVCFAFSDRCIASSYRPHSPKSLMF